MGKPWADHGQAATPYSAAAPERDADLVFYWSGRRDSNSRPSPWQKKAMVVIATVTPTPASRLLYAGSSAQSAESAPLRPSWFNALNLCDIELDASVAEHGGDFEGSAQLGDDGAQHVER